MVEIFRDRVRWVRVNQRQKDTEWLIALFSFQYLKCHLEMLIVAGLATITASAVEHRQRVGSQAAQRRSVPSHRFTIRPLRHACVESLSCQRIVLAKPEDIVSCLFEIPKQVWLFRPKQIEKTPMAAYAGRPPGEHAASRWTADRILHMTIRESRSLLCESIKIWRLSHGISVTG